MLTNLEGKPRAGDRNALDSTSGPGVDRLRSQSLTICGTCGDVVNHKFLDTIFLGTRLAPRSEPEIVVKCHRNGVLV
jgi:hypothetical protein